MGQYGRPNLALAGLLVQLLIYILTMNHTIIHDLAAVLVA